MCTFNNISIKLTRTVCIFCRMNHVIFTKFSIVFFLPFSSSCSLFIFTLSFSFYLNLYIPLPPVLLFFSLSYPRLDHLLHFFSRLMLSIHCCLLSIGNRDIFIRFRFCLHFILRPRDPFHAIQNEKLIWMWRS